MMDATTTPNAATAAAAAVAGTAIPLGSSSSASSPPSNVHLGGGTPQPTALPNKRLTSKTISFFLESARSLADASKQPLSAFVKLSVAPERVLAVAEQDPGCQQEFDRLKLSQPEKLARINACLRKYADTPIVSPKKRGRKSLSERPDGIPSPTDLTPDSSKKRLRSDSIKFDDFSLTSVTSLKDAAAIVAAAADASQTPSHLRGLEDERALAAQTYPFSEGTIVDHQLERIINESTDPQLVRAARRLISELNVERSTRSKNYETEPKQRELRFRQLLDQAVHAVSELASVCGAPLYLGVVGEDGHVHAFGSPSLYVWSAMSTASLEAFMEARAKGLDINISPANVNVAPSSPLPFTRHAGAGEGEREDPK